MVATIAILGAGPSGLTLARLLDINGFDYVVFERNQTVDAIAQGGSLDIHYDTGQLALREAGLINEFNAYARYDGQRAEMVDKNNHRIWLRGDEGQNEKPEIDRKDLRSLLLNSIPPEKIQWDHKVESVCRAPDGAISIKFCNGRIESGFRLIVGADGAWSKVRPLITAATPEYSGFHYLQTTILPSNDFYPRIPCQVGRGTYIAVGSRKQMAAQYTGDGSYNIYVGLQLPEHWNQGLTKTTDDSELHNSLLGNEFADWAPELQGWIKHSDGSIHAWPLYEMPIDSLGWSPVPGVTLIGDAAHVSTPFVGEGVNCSMFDSLQLAKEIIQSGIEGLDDAGARYEKAMFPRAIDLITRSFASGELLFAEDATERFKAMIAEMTAHQ